MASQHTERWWLLATSYVCMSFDLSRIISHSFIPLLFLAVRRQDPKQSARRSPRRRAHGRYTEFAWRTSDRGEGESEGGGVGTFPMKAGVLRHTRRVEVMCKKRERTVDTSAWTFISGDRERMYVCGVCSVGHDGFKLGLEVDCVYLLGLRNGCG